MIFWTLKDDVESSLSTFLGMISLFFLLLDLKRMASRIFL